MIALPSVTGMEVPYSHEALSRLKCKNRYHRTFKGKERQRFRKGATISLFQRHYISLDELIKRLQFVKPKYQYFFASESAISALKKVE